MLVKNHLLNLKELLQPHLIFYFYHIEKEKFN